MNIDVGLLQQELEDINQERIHVDERLREYAIRGRGRGALLPRGLPPGPPSHAVGPARHEGAGPHRQQIPPFNDRRGSAQYRSVRQLRPQGGFDHTSNASSADFADGRVNSVSDRQRVHVTASGASNQAVDHIQRSAVKSVEVAQDGPALPGPPPVRERKKVLSSAVVVGDTQVMPGEATDVSPGIAKRPRDESDDNPALKKRNKRMFGALLGTLQRFKEEDAAARNSRLAQLREEALKRADARAAEEVQRAREHERQQLAQQRIAELNRKRELSAAAEVKKMEIALAHRYARQALLAKFLRTAAKPPLFWKPAKHCADTILLEEQRQLDLAVWMENEKAKLDEERTKVIDRTKAIIAQAEKARTAPVLGRPVAVTSVVMTNGQPDPVDGADAGQEVGPSGNKDQGDEVDEPAGPHEMDADEAHDSAAHANGADDAKMDRMEEGTPQEAAETLEDGDEHEEMHGDEDEEVAETVEDLLK